jgi:RNA polymerase sigma-70 factor (ECF subfamily)
MCGLDAGESRKGEISRRFRRSCSVVVLEKLTPAERVAFVLHDIFDVPFEEIDPLVDRTPATARQLASRAPRPVRSQLTVSPTELSTRRRIVVEFLDAVRAGNLDAIVGLLNPNVVLRGMQAQLLVALR